MTKTLVPVLMSIGFGLLAAGWGLAQGRQAGLVVVLLLALCLALLWRKYRGAPDLALALLVGVAALGMWMEVNFFLAFGGVLCALAAWDLDNFARRLVFASAEDHPARLEREHLLYIALVLAAGLAISAVSLSIRVAFNFEWAIVLAVIVFIGTSALVRWLGDREG